jgi:very-short-patch-repair endonuclease
MTSPASHAPSTERRLETRRPFTRADAIAAGIPARELRGSRFRRMFNGVYIDARVPDHPLIRAQAALVVHPPSAYASHMTAARVYGLPVPSHPAEHVTVENPADRSKRQGIVCHVGRTSDVREVSGVRVSGPHRTFIELASMLSLVDLVVVGDALVRMGKVTPDSLVAACERAGNRFARAALRAARYVRAEVDSPMETRLRMLILLAGLPEPEVNHKVRDESGRVTRRFDLSYPSVRLIVEYDGRHHVEVKSNWESDLKRREELDDAGWRILVVTSDGIYRAPAETVLRIHATLRRCGWRGLPARPGDAWRPHFPTRRS